MKLSHWATTLALLGLLTLGVGAAAAQDDLSGVGDSLYPELGNAGIDVLHYDIVLQTPVTEDTITATTTLRLRALQDLAVFHLDLLGLSVDSITVNGEPATFERDGGELIITPATPLAQGDEVVVEVQYHGQPNPPIDESLGSPIGWLYSPDNITVVSEVDGSRSWYPVNDHPSDKATYTFTITVPEGQYVAANGVLTDMTEADGQATYHYDMDQPMASYLATVNIDEFEVFESESPNGVPLRNVLPERYNLFNDRVFGRQGEMIDFLSETFGPYPFDVYGGIIVDTPLDFALENQTMSVFGAPMLASSDSDLVVVHEMAHQWFGDSVSLEDWSDIWLNEGFATYAEWLWTEYTDGPAARDAMIRDSYDYMSGQAFVDQGASPAEARSIVEQFGAVGQPPAEDLFNGGVYVRGALTLHALRLLVGDDAFFNIMRTYYATYAGGNATTADFIATAEAVSGRRLEDFFRLWLYETDLPPIPQLGLQPQIR